MKILVLVKEVPDTYGERKLNLETGIADRAASDAVVDEVSERALEVALSYADSEDAEIVVVSAAPEGATTSIRKALSMGAASAVHVADEALVGADVRRTAEVLAAAIKREGYDLVIAGNASTDGVSGMVPAAIAEVLEVPVLSYLDSVEITADSVSGTRTLEDGVQRVRASLPAVISVTEALPEARFPNFKGIMAAKKKPIDVVTLADLDVAVDEDSTPASILVQVAERPPREAGQKIVDEGDAGQKIAAFLTENNLV